MYSAKLSPWLWKVGFETQENAPTRCQKGRCSACPFDSWFQWRLESYAAGNILKFLKSDCISADIYSPSRLHPTQAWASRPRLHPRLSWFPDVLNASAVLAGRFWRICGIICGSGVMTRVRGWRLTSLATQKSTVREDLNVSRHFRAHKVLSKTNDE